MASPCFTTPPRNTRHNIPRRPCNSAIKPARIFSISSHGSHTALTSNSTLPTCSRCPTDSAFTFSPSVVMFSLVIPGARSIVRSVSMSINNTCRFPPGRACAHPSMPAFSITRTSWSSCIARRRFGARNKCKILAIHSNPPPRKSSVRVVRCPFGTACHQSEFSRRLDRPSLTPHPANFLLP